MQSGRSNAENEVARRNEPKQANEVRVTISVELNPFGLLRASDVVYFESETEGHQLDEVVVPAATPLDEVIHQIGNPVVLG